jgi:hypothetical protein
MGAAFKAIVLFVLIYECLKNTVLGMVTKFLNKLLNKKSVLPANSAVEVTV